MKKCLLIICLSALWAITALGQVPAQPPTQVPAQSPAQSPTQTPGQTPEQEEQDPAIKQQRIQRVQNLKMAYINQQLNLSADESKQFWPLYFQYEKEVRGINTNLSLDEISREEAILNVRKRYQDQFTRVLGRNRSTYFFQLERNFNQMLIRRLNHPGAGARMGMHKGF